MTAKDDETHVRQRKSTNEKMLDRVRKLEQPVVQTDGFEGVLEACGQGWNAKRWNKMVCHQFFRDVVETCKNGVFGTDANARMV